MADTDIWEDRIAGLLNGYTEPDIDADRLKQTGEDLARTLQNDIVIEPSNRYFQSADEKSKKRPVFLRKVVSLSLAACLLITAGICFYILLHMPRPIGIQLTGMNGGVTVRREGERTPSEKNMDICSGDRIKTDREGKAKLTYTSENTFIKLSEGTELEMNEEPGLKLIRLGKGRIECTAAPQPQGKSMILTTPHARAEVMGTRFILSVMKDRSRLEVKEGKVRYSRLNESESAVVCTGQYCSIGPGTGNPAVFLAVTKEEDKPAQPPILDTRSLWHCRFIKGTELIRKESGNLDHIVESPLWQRVREQGKYIKKTTHSPVMRRRPASVAANWTAADFNDSSWGLYPGPFMGMGNYYSWHYNICEKTRLIFLRAKFQVDDPAKAGDLTLSMGFEGGAAVYVNGEEVTRVHLPKGKLDFSTPAEDYPEDVYFRDGKLVGGDMYKKYPEMFKKRVRRLGGVQIPGSMLRKGVNVLAIRLQCAPLPEKVFTAKTVPNSYRCLIWPRVGLESLTLSVSEESPVTPGARFGDKAKGFRVWNHPVTKQIRVADFGDPCDVVHPVRITGVPNGVFSGVVAVSCDQAVKDLKASCSELKGPAIISPSAIELRYPRADRPGRGRNAPPVFDTLEHTAPAEIPVSRYGIAVQPVWIRVRVPADTGPGVYNGSMMITASGQEPVEVPLALKIINWKMPDPETFATHMGLVQSPDSIAAKYEVEMWSPEHWDMVEKSFRLMGQLGARSLYLPLVARTHFGNAHSMVRWIKQTDGTYTHDFSIIQRYVDLAVKHFGGNIPVVCAYAWTPVKLASNYAGKSAATKSNFKGILGGDGKDADEFFKDREILFSVMDPVSKKLEVQKGPKWGTPECDAFWKPVMAGLKKILAGHGLEKSMLVGICGDFTPGEGAVNTLAAAAPWAKWVVHSHTTSWLRKGVRNQSVGCMVFVWGGYPWSPDMTNKYSHRNRFTGWQCPKIVGKFGRNEFRQHESPQSEFRAFPEACILAAGVFGPFGPKGKKDHTGVDGLDRIGADFWPVIKDRRGRGKILAGYYVNWGGLDISAHGIHYVIGPGEKGPVATTRFEMLRECLQECQARIFLEKTLADTKRRGKLGEEWAKRTQELLDRRTRVMIDFGITYQGKHDKRYFVCSDWQNRSEKLYTSAAEAAEKLSR